MSLPEEELLPAQWTWKPVPVLHECEPPNSFRPSRVWRGVVVGNVGDLFKVFDCDGCKLSWECRPDYDGVVRWHTLSLTRGRWRHRRLRKAAARANG